MSIESFSLIESRKEFLELMTYLKGFNLLGVDLEGEWNLHRYGLHLCLIQISDGENIFLVDPLKVGDLKPFLEIMEDPDIEVVSHGPQSDIVLLDYLFGCHPRNIFDTENAGQLLGYESTSLSWLLEKHFGISKNMKVRVSDWNKRPLSDKMLAYAAKDVAYLHELRELLTNELIEMDRLGWHQEECKGLEDVRYRKKENPHLEIQKANKLDLEEAHLLKYLYELRDSIAREMDKPAYYIIPNAKLVQLAQEPPASEEGWGSLKGVNPRVKRFAGRFHQAVLEAREEKPVEARRSPAHNSGMSRNAFFRLVDKRTQVLGAIRDQIKEEYDIYPMILSMRNLKRVAYGEANLNDFKAWQRQIMLEKAEQLDLDVSILIG